MFTLNIISLMFTLVHVHLFSIVFYLRTLIGRLLALGGSGSLWVAMARYGWLWVAMARSGSFRCLVPPKTCLFTNFNGVGGGRE